MAAHRPHRGGDLHGSVPSSARSAPAAGRHAFAAGGGAAARRRCSALARPSPAPHAAAPTRRAAAADGRVSPADADGGGVARPAPRRLGREELRRLVADRRASGGGAHAVLTSQIKLCVTWQEAYALFLDFGDAFNALNIAAYVTHVGQLAGRTRAPPGGGDGGRGDGPAPPSLSSPYLSPAGDRDGGPTASTSTGAGGWAAAAPAPPGGGLHPGDQRAFDDMLLEMRDVATEVLHLLGPRELANTAHGFARLGAYDRRLLQLLTARARPGAMRPQELANLAWALATLGHAPDAQWTAALLQARPRALLPAAATVAAPATTAREARVASLGRRMPTRPPPPLSLALSRAHARAHTRHRRRRSSSCAT